MTDGERAKATPAVASGVVSYADHPEWLAFVAGIRAAPDDDLPRLVAADWLDERGEHDRAEFIRVQCESARIEAEGRRPEGRPQRNTYDGVKFTSVLSEHHDRYVALRRRELVLLPGACRWLPDEIVWSHAEGPVRADPGKEPVGVWRRGFIGEVVCDAAAWLAHGDAILRQHPVRRVRLTTRPKSNWFWSEASGVPNERNVEAALSRYFPGVEFGLPPASPRHDPALLQNMAPEERARLLGPGLRQSGSDET